jgi:hypothetical protein
MIRMHRGQLERPSGTGRGADRPHFLRWLHDMEEDKAGHLAVAREAVRVSEDNFPPLSSQCQ